MAGVATIWRGGRPDANAVEVLTRWLVWWRTNVTPSFGDILDAEGLDPEDIEAYAYVLAAALVAPEMNGPLANPEFVSRLPGASVVKLEGTVTITRGEGA